MHVLKQDKQRIKSCLNPQLGKIIVFIVSFIMLVLTTYIFYLQSKDILSSDLCAHVNFSLEGKSNYSLLHFIMRILGTNWGNTLSISLFLGLCSVGGILSGLWLLCILAPLASRLSLFFCSLACFFEIAIYTPPFGSIYLGSYGSGYWHNPTFVLLKPLATLSLIFFLKVLSGYRHMFPWKNYFLFVTFLTLSTMAKPNFFITFGPVIAIVLLRELFVYTKKVFFKVIVLGLSVVPSLAVGIVQSFILFQQTEKITIELAPLKVLHHFTIHPQLRLLASLAFPVVVLLYLFRFFKNNAAGYLILLNALFAFSYVFLLDESGVRSLEGNFMWGAYIATHLLFILSISILCQWQAENNIIHAGNHLQKTCFWIMFGLFMLHAITGFVYFVLLFWGFPAIQ